ncbi:hypothetical protein ACH42_04755 [Endozoicomonas sp. (ex Bugula neritina AB1)]|nr:hypothetical protein ACH42_04755 [Endozoicomonas sp. (ex Bugula neritina AB1)]
MCNIRFRIFRTQNSIYFLPAVTDQLLNNHRLPGARITAAIENPSTLPGQTTGLAAFESAPTEEASTEEASTEEASTEEASTEEASTEETDSIRISTAGAEPPVTPRAEDFISISIFTPQLVTWLTRVLVDTFRSNLESVEPLHFQAPTFLVPDVAARLPGTEANKGILLTNPDDHTFGGNSFPSITITTIEGSSQDEDTTEWADLIAQPLTPEQVAQFQLDQERFHTRLPKKAMFSVASWFTKLLKFMSWKKRDDDPDSGAGGSGTTPSGSQGSDWRLTSSQKSPTTSSTSQGGSGSTNGGKQSSLSELKQYEGEESYLNLATAFLAAFILHQATIKPLTSSNLQLIFNSPAISY